MPTMEQIAEIEDFKNILIPKDCIDRLDIRKVLIDTCHRLDSKLVNDVGIPTYVSGSTGVISIFTGNYVFTANVGDSGALLLEERGGILTYYQPTELTRDLKPTLKEERKRIVANGGEIKRFMCKTLILF
jgi:serine/threonine protein phosphatase PrpC